MDGHRPRRDIRSRASDWIDVLDWDTIGDKSGPLRPPSAQTPPVRNVSADPGISDDGPAATYIRPQGKRAGMQDEPKNSEPNYSLKALELEGCPFYVEGDHLDVKLPGVFGHRAHCCTMPVTSFLPIALDNPKDEGTVESGFRDCSCKWTFCKVTGQSKARVEFEEMMTAEDRIGKSFLDQLPEPLLRALKQSAHVVRHPRGSVIVRENASGQHFHVLLSGLVRIVSETQGRRPLELNLLRKGDCFGELSLLTGAATSNKVEAAEDSVTLSVPRKEFHRLISEYPLLSIVLYRMLSKRIRTSNLRLAQLLSPGISGDLSLFGFADLAQSIHTAQMTGMLHIESGQRKAQCGFDHGKLVHATARNQAGLEAVMELIRWKNGPFRFAANEACPPPNLSGDTMATLLDALRRMDESSVLERKP